MVGSLQGNHDIFTYWRIFFTFIGHFVRISYDEVSVSHPDAVRKLLLAPIPKVWTKLSPILTAHEKLIVIKGYWYKGTTIPDYRYIAPMSVCDPKAKIALSKALSPGYSQSTLFKPLYVMHWLTVIKAMCFNMNRISPGPLLIFLIGWINTPRIEPPWTWTTSSPMQHSMSLARLYSLGPSDF